MTTTESQKILQISGKGLSTNDVMVIRGKGINEFVTAV